MNIDITSSVVQSSNDLTSSSAGLHLPYSAMLSDRHSFTRTSGGEASPSRNGGHLSYTSDKHPRHFLESMCLLYKRHELCDVTICVGTHRIPAHKVVLSACSPYFCAMFTGNKHYLLKSFASKRVGIIFIYRILLLLL